LVMSLCFIHRNSRITIYDSHKSSISLVKEMRKMVIVLKKENKIISHISKH